MKRYLRENFIFLAISVIAFATEPGILRAQTSEYAPINFTQALNLSRGSLFPTSRGAVYLSHDDSCKFVQKEFGWESDSCNAIEIIVFGHMPGVDSLIIDKPNSEGYVKFDDWEKEKTKEEISEIWNNLVEGARAQSKKIGKKIEPVKWYAYPTLNKEKSYMYYATLIKWEGDPVLNVKVTLFDRRGYVVFGVVPEKVNLSEYELVNIIESTIDSYKSKKQESYFDFRSGDKVAAVGAVGVLATLLGVKYGKGLAAGFFAILLVLAKKLWFLILVPFVFLKKWIFGKRD